VAAINFDKPSGGKAKAPFGGPACWWVDNESDGEAIRATTTSKDAAAIVGVNNYLQNAAAYGYAILGTATKGGVGVRGESNGDIPAAGIAGYSAATTPNAAPAVYGLAKNGKGVIGESADNVGVYGVTESTNAAAIYGKALGTAKLAGYFEGNVTVKGIISSQHADCAEDFDTSSTEDLAAGTVIVLNNEGLVEQSHHAYDKKVAGVVSGAGGNIPGIVLDRQASQTNRKPIALMGKVYCKVDASYSSIEVGDMLTTSDTPGHAMKALDPSRAFGAVIGKALRQLKTGTGLVPVLVALQ